MKTIMLICLFLALYAAFIAFILSMLKVCKRGK